MGSSGPVVLRSLVLRPLGSSGPWDPEILRPCGPPAFRVLRLLACSAACSHPQTSWVAASFEQSPGPKPSLVECWFRYKHPFGKLPTQLGLLPPIYFVFAKEATGRSSVARDPLEARHTRHDTVGRRPNICCTRRLGKGLRQEKTVGNYFRGFSDGPRRLRSGLRLAGTVSI